MSDWAAMVRLHDADLLLDEARDPGLRQRARSLGLEYGGLPALERARARLCSRIERRWLLAYERAQRRYGRAVVMVRARVCQGCHITLPTSAGAAGETAGLCESCGRILLSC